MSPNRKKLQKTQPIPPQVLREEIKEVVKTEFFIGPVPSPDMIRRYEELYPDAAKFFFETFKNQSEHRMELEKATVAANIKSERRGQWLAFILALVSIGSGVFLLLKDKDIAGLTTIIASLGGLLSTFFVQKQRNIKELKRKRPESR